MSSSLQGCAKHRLADDDSVEDVKGVDGGRSKVMIDGSPLPDAGETGISFSESSADEGERKVIGEGVCSDGVGGRFDRGGGMREGGTGRKRDTEGCR